MNRMVYDKISMSLITLLALLLLAGSVSAAPSEDWNRTFGGSGVDVFLSVQETADNGFVAAGYTNSYGAGEDEAWLVKTDRYGKEIWNKTFGGAVSDKFLSVRQTSDGGFILGGETYSSRGEGAWLLKTDENGSEQWNRTFRGSRLVSVLQTSDGGYAIAGGSGFLPASILSTIWLARTDANGNELWNRSFKSGKGDRVNSLRQTLDGGYVVSGGYYSYFGFAAWIIKTDIDGNEQWSKTFPAKGCPEVSVPGARPVPPVIGNSMANDILQTPEGGYIMAGYMDVYTDCSGTILQRDRRFLLMRMDENGTVQWERTFTGNYWDTAFSVLKIADGRYLMSGEKCSIIPDKCSQWLGSKCIDGDVKCNAWLIGTDADGNEQWNRTFGETEFDAASSIIRTSDGGYILAGVTISHENVRNQAWLAKLKDEQDVTAFAGIQDEKPAQKVSGLGTASITILLAAYTTARKMKQKGRK